MIVRVVNRNNDFCRFFHDVQHVEYTGGNTFWIFTFESSYAYTLSEFNFFIMED